MWKFIIIAAFSILWAFKASEGFDGLQKPSKTGCNSTIEKNNSGFELNWHNLSKPCFWNISTTGSITLFFFKVFLHEKDELTLYRNPSDAESGTNPIMKNPIPSQNGTVTIITDEHQIVIKLVGKEPNYDRIFEGFYYVNACSVAVPPDVETLYSPMYVKSVTDKVECSYRFNEIPHKRVKQVFTFEEFHMSSSSVHVEGGTVSGNYNNDPPTDFFIDDSVLTLTVDQAVNSSDYFRLKIHEVDSSCSGKYEFQEAVKNFASPQNELNNGSILYECRWLVQHNPVPPNPPGILGFKLNKVDFHSVFDIAAINDGSAENSPPLFQVTKSNKNITQNEVIRGSGSSLWISFKPFNYESRFDFNITVHGQGGYFRNNGTITMQHTTGDDTAFLLEVDANKIVELTVVNSSITPPATVSVYDGFDTSKLLTSLHGQINFPVFSRSSRMMVTGTNFSALSNYLSAKFKGIIPGCNHMSSLSTENYILYENCNSTCTWIIPPQDFPNSALIVYLQYISLKEGDSLKIYKLGSNLTELAEIGANITHVPHFSVPADVGVQINVTQSKCEKKMDKIVLIGHASYIPACDHDIITKLSERFQISSPLYPDTYPVFANCHWNVTVPKESIVHVVFEKLNLAKNHCIKISQNSSEPNMFDGNTLPNDLFLRGNMLVDFDSSGCNKSKVGSNLNSDSGFLLNVTVAGCGNVINDKDGEFNTSITDNKAVCIWKVSVPPPKDGKSVNIISYVVNKKDGLKNCEFHVYDGSTVRDSEIVNNTGSAIWSRTNTLIFVYKRLNVSQSSSVLIIKYNTISCNSSMLCDNNICLHPDWRCNGVNDCGDFSDERNCESVPIPPKVEHTGYSAVAFWLCIIAMLIIGVILGITVPVCYQKYKDSRYRQFHELDG